MTNTMRAVTYRRYAGPEQMTLTSVPVPQPGPGQVRIKVGAAALNPYDWHIYRGDPAFARVAFGLFGPGERVLGSDVAGVVDSVGPGVTGLAVGDAVFGGINFGACAEYAIGKVSSLALSPAGVDAVAAAALPMASATALASVRDARVAAGSRVLVIGAAGGVGHLTVQIARALGAARVVGVCSGANASFVERLGADRVIDYRTERVEDCGEQFDAVIDLVATTPVRRLRRIVAPGGIYAIAGGLAKGGLLGPLRQIALSRLSALASRVTWRSVGARYAAADLEHVAAWVEAGEVTPAIAGVYAFEDVREALTRLEAQHVAGKLVLTPTL